MANLLRQIALILTAGVAACGAAAPFSHRVHLARKLDCVVCHSAAISSSKVSDNLIPGPAICANCHNDSRAQYEPKTPRQSNVQKFNHQLHVKLGLTVAGAIVRAIDGKTYLGDPGSLRAQLEGTKHACTGCHRGLANSDTVSAADFPAMADCLVCHNRIDVPFSCEKCHEDIAALKPASHTPNFLDKHSDKNVEKVGCAVCHGRRFTCLGCH